MKIIFWGGLGIIITTLMNYYNYGLGNVVPDNIFFNYYNSELFNNLWNRLNFDYWFAGEKSGLNFSILSISDIIKYIRFNHLINIIINFSIPAIIGLAFICRGSLSVRNKRLLLFIQSFFFSVLIFASFFKQDSIYRVLIIFIILELIVIIYISWFGLERILKFNYNFINFAFIVLVILTTAQILSKNLKQNPGRLNNNVQYLIGNFSFLRTIDAFIPNDPSGSIFYKILEFRKIVGAEGRILNMYYAPSVIYFFPERLISEPSYSFGNEYPELLFSKPDISRKILEKNNIKYFALKMDAQPFLAIPFSRLFDSSELKNNFKIIYMSGDFYILGFLEEGEKSNLDSNFISDYKKFIDLNNYKWKFKQFNELYLKGDYSF